MLVPLTLRPGIDKESTRYGAEGGWVDGDKVRFWMGSPQAIYGWEDIGSGASTVGICRGLFAYEDLSGNVYVAVGTSQRWYIWSGGVFYDVTPFRKSDIVSNPFTTTAGSNTVVITDIAHGAQTGDVVNVSNADSVGGVTIGGDFTVTRIDPVTLSVQVPQTATLSQTGGGANVNLSFYINVGLESGSAGVGYSVGPYGVAGYGTSRAGAPRAFRSVRLWSFDDFGQDVIGAYAGGPLYYFSTAAGLQSKAQQISQGPSSCEMLLVGKPDRHVIAYGADGDPMLVRWTSAGLYTDWTATQSNDAGSQRLQGGSRIVGAVQGEAGILVWTDTGLIQQSFIGFPYAFGFKEISSGCGLVAMKAAVIHNSIAYWMGVDNFYLYDGRVQPIPCPVRRYVFQDINLAQRAKFHAGVCRPFNEIWFFYCSAGSNEIDRYVSVSITDGTWHIGNMPRTAYVDGKSLLVPIATDPDGFLYKHETGTTANGAPLASRLTSAQMDFGEGDRFVFFDKIVPDFDFDGDADTATIAANIYNYPDASRFSTRGPYTITPTTAKISTRGRARTVDWTIQASNWWRLGKLRVNYQPDGSR